MTYNIRILLNKKVIEKTVEHRIDTVQAKLDAQIMKDSNYFCPQDTSVLQHSVINSSKLGSGLLVWNTPYAHKQYYENLDHSKNRNPNACMKWFEAAKAKNLKNWEWLANAEYRKVSK